MIIMIEGPEKAGKTTLVEAILDGFDEDRSERHHCYGKDSADGIGYLRPFIKHLDSSFVSVWDRAWIGEIVYGRLLSDGRWFARDEFMCEWIYGRLLNGRGGKFVLLPEDCDELRARRDESDLEVDPIAESRIFKTHANRYDYEVLTNLYDEESLRENTLKARKSIFVDTHKIPSTEYVGPLKPVLTFVGDTQQEWSVDHRPFNNTIAAEYFRPFGYKAINLFGYSSVDGYAKNFEKYPKLFKQTIAVGPRAKHYFPNLPEAPYQAGQVGFHLTKSFADTVFEIAEASRYE